MGGTRRNPRINVMIGIFAICTLKMFSFSNTEKGVRKAIFLTFWKEHLFERERGRQTDKQTWKMLLEVVGLYRVGKQVSAVQSDT